MTDSNSKTIDADFTDSPSESSGIKNNASGRRNASAASAEPDNGIFRMLSESLTAFIHRPLPIIPSILESLSVACVTLAFLFAFAHFSVFSFMDVFRDVTLKSIFTYDFLKLVAGFIIDNIGILSLLIILYMAARLFMSSFFFSGMIRTCLDIYRGEKEGDRNSRLSIIGHIIASPVKVFAFRLMRFLIMGASTVLLLPAIYVLAAKEISIWTASLTIILIILPIPLILIWLFLVDYNLFLGSYSVVIDDTFPSTAVSRSRTVMKKNFLKYSALWLIDKILSLGFFILSIAGSAIGLSFIGTILSVFIVKPYFVFLLVRFYGGCSEKEETRNIFCRNRFRSSARIIAFSNDAPFLIMSVSASDYAEFVIY